SWGGLPQALALSVVSLFAAGLLVMHSRLARLDGRGPPSPADPPTGRGGGIRETAENATASFTGGPRGRAPGARLGRIRCDGDPGREVLGRVAYWDDPRSDRDRAMAASPPPFSEEVPAEDGGGGGRRPAGGTSRSSPTAEGGTTSGWSSRRWSSWPRPPAGRSSSRRQPAVPADEGAKSKHRSLLAFFGEERPRGRRRDGDDA
ncbi:hypothetical protein THAOC_29951, partial [Thalassiosira oceanica]